MSIGPAATYVTATCLMVSACSLGGRWLLTKKQFPNYPNASPRQRFIMALYGVVLAGLSVYRWNSPALGGFEVDAAGACVSILMMTYHANEAWELLRSRLDPIIWRRVAYAKAKAHCEWVWPPRWGWLGRLLEPRRKRPSHPSGVAVGALALEGLPVAAPFELPCDTPDFIEPDQRRVLQILAGSTAH